MLKKLINIFGDMSRIHSNMSEISGDVSGIYINLDKYKITEIQRKEGINIMDLINDVKKAE